MPTDASRQQLSRIRPAPEVIRNTLDQLDESARQGQPYDSRRSSNRFNYRVNSVELETRSVSGNEWVTHVVATRNLSRDGMSCLAVCFLYPGSECRVKLMTLHNSRHVAVGKIVRCRYISGTARLHEIGIRFDAPIDVGLFARDAVNMRVLLVDDDEVVHKIISRLLSAENVEVVSARDGAEGRDKALQDRYDVIIMDLDLPQMDGMTAVAELREKGYAGPIVALTASENAEVREKCMSGGFTEWVSKPFTKESIESVILALRDEPLISTLVQDPVMAPMIDEFVERLGRDVLAMEKALREKEYAELDKQVTAIKGKAGTVGFQVISQAASLVHQGIAAKAEHETIHQQLRDLCRLCRAARPASANLNPRPAGGSADAGEQPGEPDAAAAEKTPAEPAASA